MHKKILWGVFLALCILFSSCSTYSADKKTASVDSIKNNSQDFRLEALNRLQTQMFSPDYDTIVNKNLRETTQNTDTLDTNSIDSIDSIALNAQKDSLELIVKKDSIKEHYLDKKIKTIINKMSLKDKAAQMIIVYHSPSTYMLKHHYGGSLVMNNSFKNIENLKKDIALLQNKMPIPVLITTDQEGGTVDRLKKIEELGRMNSAAIMGKMKPEEISNYVIPWANKLKELGINTNLAPVLDPAKDWQGNYTFMFNSNRSYGEDSSTVINSANAFMDGFKSKGILCISKHFPGYDVQTNSDHELAISLADSNHVAKQIETFAATAKHANGVMMTSIKFDKFSDKPAVFDPKIVSWAKKAFPNAIIMTDDLWGTSLRAFAADTTDIGRKYSNENLKKLTMYAFDAGNDMLMMTYPAMAEKMILMIATEAKRNPRRKVILDQAVYKILKVKIISGIIN